MKEVGGLTLSLEVKAIAHRQGSRFSDMPRSVVLSFYDSDRQIFTTST